MNNLTVGFKTTKSRRSSHFGLLHIIVLVLMLVSCRQSPAYPVSYPKDAQLRNSAASQECTSFCLENNGYCIFGTNFDSSPSEGIQGMLYVNKKDVSKTSWDQSTTGEVANWTSQYGSLTFNLVGYQYPWAGMNEAGLMISTMSLYESLAPAPDERPPLEAGLWLQYQLDNFSSVEQVIASQSRVMLTSGVPGCCHLFVCDNKGHCATVEMLNGEMVYHLDETLPVDALTNSIYAESIQAWQTRSQEELADVEWSAFSLFRFATAADAVTHFQPASSEAAVDYAFDTLARASIPGLIPDLTVWSIVFDPHNLRAHFRSIENSQIRVIDFNRLDFACGTPVQMLEVHADLSGDISADLEPYSHAASLDHSVTMSKLLGFGFPPEQTDSLLREMERFPCADGEAHIVQEPSQVSPWLWLIIAALLVTISVSVWLGTRKRVNRVE